MNYLSKRIENCIDLEDLLILSEKIRQKRKLTNNIIDRIREKRLSIIKKTNNVKERSKIY
jgi:hypothetical protein